MRASARRWAPARRFAARRLAARRFAARRFARRLFAGVVLVARVVLLAVLTPPAAFAAIQGRSVSSATRPYTPGRPGRAQPSPKLVVPTTRSAPVDVRPNIGPPESPWQVSTPPCGKPAQTIVFGSKSL
jgi:hypothetical protein